MRKLKLTIVMLLAFVIHAVAQDRTISGKVTDDKGAALAGVSVATPDGKAGTQTNADGTYQLKVGASAKVLLYSFVNLETVTKSIGSQTVINVTLISADKALTEVVVVGYGTQKKKAVTAAQTKINPGTVNTLATASVDQQLGGRAAGLQVTNSSGLVNQAPRIRIRGVNSISQGRDPLIVLDGVPTYSGGFSGVANSNVLSDINPADIESIDVLKDGSATAIYGSRAANGVILITTKRGKNSSRSALTYSATFGSSKPFRKFDLLNADQFITVANEKLTNAGLAAAAFKNSENTNTDWQDVAMRSRANTQNHSLSFEGGNDKTSVYFSFNYAAQEGLIKTNLNKRYGAKMNVEHRVNDWLKVGNNLTISRSEDNDQNNGGNALSGAIANALRALPNVRAYDPTNTAFGGYNIKADGSALGRDANTRDIENNYTNLAFVLDKNKFKSTRYRVINNAFAEVKIIKGLTYKLQASVDYNNGTDFQGYDSRHGDGRSSGGIVFNQSIYRNRYTLQNLVNYSTSFGQHGISAVAGYEIQRDESGSFYAQGTAISDVFFLSDNIIGGSFVNQFSGGGFGKSGFTSLFGRVNYDFKDRYFAQISARRDGQSSLAEAKRYGTFPGFSVGWRASEEDFWKNTGINKVVNDFKIRGGYAVVGNTLGGFPFLSTYGAAQYGGLNGITVNNVGNADLEWETNKKFNIGVDVALLNNRFNVTFDWFKNNNDNLVLAAPLPVSFGVPGNSVSRNIGSSVNQGLELTLSGNVLTKKDFTWDFSFNYTHTTNKITSLYLDQDVIGSYNILRVGQPLNALFGYQYAGVNSGNGNPMYTKADGSLIQGNIPNSSYFGVVKPDDATLGTATTLAATDRAILGNVLPTYFGGFSNTFKYKGFSLDVFFKYAGGNYIFNQTAQESLFNQGFTNNSTDILNRWTTAGQVTNVPKLWYGRENFINLNQSGNSRFVEKGDYIKLENVVFSYNLDKNTLQKYTKGAIRNLRLFVQGQNLLLISDFSGIDPENITEAGINYNVVPSAKNISFGLSVGL